MAFDETDKSGSIDRSDAPSILHTGEGKVLVPLTLKQIRGILEALGFEGSTLAYADYEELRALLNRAGSLIDHAETMRRIIGG